MYFNALPLTRAEAEKLFLYVDDAELAVLLLRLGEHEADWQWVQAICLQHLNDRDESVARAAILALGDLVQVHRQLDVDIVAKQLHDVRPSLQDVASDALDDLTIFVQSRHHRYKP